jgi:hypothetical protein
VTRLPVALSGYTFPTWCVGFPAYVETICTDCDRPRMSDPCAPCAESRGERAERSLSAYYGGSGARPIEEQVRKAREIKEGRW